MKREKILAMSILLLVFLFHANEKIHAVELIVNGSFETGDFTGWSRVNGAGAFLNWTNTAAGGDTGFHTSSPQHGTRSVWNGMAGNAGSTFLLFQDITIPAGATATFTWKHRVQLDNATFCTGAACGTANFLVQALTTSNVLLQTFHNTAIPSETIFDSGWTTNSVSLNVYAGQTIRLRFGNVVSASLAGPGMAEIDQVSVNALVPTASNVTVGGKITNEGNNGLSRVPVTITDENGNTRMTYTNVFGYYQFNEVLAGETYIVMVNHRKYVFADNPRVVQVEDNLTNLDFQASP